MFKRLWIVVLALVVGGMLVSACVGGDLAEDLTPIPTLPPGEEPELRAELQVAGAAVAAPEGDDDGTADGGGEQLDEAQLVALGSDVWASMCASCHPAGADSAGPSFTGMAERAASTVEGMSAEDYLYESIVDPSAYVVDGFSDIMPKTFGDDLEDTELQGLVAYMMAESGDETAADAEEDADDADDADSSETDAESDADADAESSGDDDDATEVSSGDVANGEMIFASACGSCHGPEEGVGPALTGMGERAAERVEGMSAEDYLHESIVDPGAYVVQDFINMMPPTYGDTYSEQEIQDMIAYILTQ